MTQRFASNGTRFLPATAIRAGTAGEAPDGSVSPGGLPEDDGAPEDDGSRTGDGSWTGDGSRTGDGHRPEDDGGAPAGPEAAPSDWLAVLRLPGPERDRALVQLHALMLRAARYQVRRMRGLLPGSGPETLEELATAAADGALTALLGKLHAFEGRSRFTTWAYKFAILEAATEVRRRSWSGREVSLDVDERWSDPGPGPEQLALARDLADGVRRAMREALTPHQRAIAVALLVDEVPIDVLADRLGTTRGALYKTLHDARRRIRAHLAAAGYLSPLAPQAGAR